VTTPATSRKPLLNLLQTPPPIPSPLKSLLVARELGSPPSPALCVDGAPLSHTTRLTLLNRLEIVDDAISTSEKSQNELLRLQELTVRTEGQLSRLGALLTSASSSLAFAVEESYGLAARFEEVKSSSQAAVMDFGKFVAETCSLMLIRAPAAETCASSVPLVVSTLMEDIGNLSSQLAASGGPSTVAEVDEMISQLADSAAQLSLSLEQTREFHDVLLALDDIKADTEDASAVAGALELGSRLVAAMPKTLELLQEHKALQVHTQQQQLAIERLRDMNSNLRERVVDLNAESSASAAELEEAIQLAFTQKLALEEMSSLLAGAPEAGDPVGDAERRADAALRALSSALRAVR